MSPSRARPDAAERAFRALLRLYPRAFRDRFGDEMVDFFLARCDEQRHRGRRLARLWIHVAADVFVSAPTQHARALIARVASVTPASASDLSWASPDYPRETHPMDTLRQDIRYGLRTLIRQPAFTLVAVITLALGIGATTAIFSVVDAVLLRPLPWPQADRLVVIYGTRGAARQNGVAYLDYRDWRDQSTTFDELGIIRGQSVNLTGGETPDRVAGSFVTASTFRLLGAAALAGRLFTDAETEIATKAPVAIISEPLWRTRYASKPDLVGQTLILNGQPFAVVGIMRAGFEAPLGTPDVWMPVGYYPNQGELAIRGRGGVLVFGKLKATSNVAQTQSSLDGISERLAGLYPATNAGLGANVQLLKENIVGPSRAPVLIVLAAVATVLLIACANVANLQLTRATARRRELSVRAVLGAGRQRLVRQLLTESLVLSLAGGVVGVAIAYAGVRWLGSIVPDYLFLYGEIALNPAVLGFATLVTLLTGVTFGLAPALLASRTQLHETLRVRVENSGGGSFSARTTLVAGQVALCVVLLVSAGLLTRSLIAITRVQPGFNAEHVLTLQFRLPPAKYNAGDKIEDMFTRTIAEIRAVPGVEHAALVRATPLNGNGESFPYEIEGVANPNPQSRPTAQWNIVSSGYFDTLQIPRLQGRDFTAEDQAQGMPAMIVNEQLAKRIAPNGSAIGRRVRLAAGEPRTWATVVGVVGNAKHFQVSEQQVDQVYLPYAQRPLIFTEVVVRTPGDPMAVANAVRAAIWRVDRDQPVWRVRPLTLSIDGALGARTFIMRLLASFSVVAVLLAVIGVYGVMSSVVAHRRQELGIRMALGAQARQVLGLVLRQGMRTIVIALAIGLGLSLLATRLLEAQLFGVERTDPLTFVLVPLTLGLVALAACYLPARRASRLDPVVTLRAD